MCNEGECNGFWVTGRESECNSKGDDVVANELV